MDAIKYVVITPVRDEAEHIERTVQSMMAQSVLPKEWVVVDDGSTDGTAEILDRCARVSWITVLHRKDRGYRASGGGVVEAFNFGYQKLRDDDWDYLVKLDGDLSFDQDYFERCFQVFESDKRLGVGGGTVCKLEGLETKIDSEGDPPFHVRGAVKTYRRSCWDEIGPLAVAPGWDTIDEVKANHKGWTTRTIPELKVIQHKPTGAADGRWKNWFKNGLANYMTGYHPLFMLAKCVKRAPRAPLFVEAAALWAGFCSGYLRRIAPALDCEAMLYLRRQQLRRLMRRPSIYG